MRARLNALLSVAAAVWCAPHVALGANPPTSERGVLVRVITQWTGGCDGSKRTAWDNMVRAWYNDITNSGSTPGGHASKAWVEDGFYQNGAIVDSDFTDPSIVSWGNDNGSDRADEPDVCMIAMHGGESTDNLRYFGRVRVNEAGSGNCDTWQGSMLFGNDDAEFIHFSSCHSMDRDVWWPEWSSSFGRVHQINGWHGLMWISTSYNNRYRDFSDDAFDIAIADAWVDNHYDNAFWAWEYDHCPVSRGTGATEADLWFRMDHEEYDDVYSDPTSNWHGVIYIKGCDPKDDPALPN